MIAVASRIATGTPVSRVHQQQQRQLGRQAPQVIVDVVADDLDARMARRRPAKHVEVAVGTAWEQVRARLDHRLCATLFAQHAADAIEDLVIGQRGRLDGRAIQVGDLQDGQSRYS